MRLQHRYIGTKKFKWGKHYFVQGPITPHLSFPCLSSVIEMRQHNNQLATFLKFICVK